jgi:hypothetical protein
MGSVLLKTVTRCLTASARGTATPLKAGYRSHHDRSIVNGPREAKAYLMSLRLIWRVAMNMPSAKNAMR